jgi:hypothetical protein
VGDGRRIGNDVSQFAFFDSLVHYYWVEGLQWFAQRKKIEHLRRKLINEFWRFAPEPNTFCRVPLVKQVDPIDIAHP